MYTALTAPLTSSVHLPSLHSLLTLQLLFCGTLIYWALHRMKCLIMAEQTENCIKFVFSNNLQIDMQCADSVRCSVDSSLIQNEMKWILTSRFSSGRVNNVCATYLYTL